MHSTDPTQTSMGCWKVKAPVLTAEDVVALPSMFAGLTAPIVDGYEITLPSGVILVWDGWDAP